ncbi:MAG: hypothetical protein HY277_06145, partial [Ignavibacteriales bacterium]|nr:hypothetical protein [Ignavibacteriales bacterium]
MSIQAQSEEFNEEWRWVHFTTESGLPSDHIYEIVETSDGTPWVATSKGLAWYDGFRWHAVPDSLGIPIALDASMDGCLTPHGKDKVFANFYEGLYDVSQNSVQKIRLNFNQKKLNNGFITSAGDLGCFVQVYDELFRYDSSRISSLKTPARLVPNWRSVFYTRNRSVWINTTEGIYRWTGN